MYVYVNGMACNGQRCPTKTLATTTKKSPAHSTNMRFAVGRDAEANAGTSEE